MSYSQNNEEQIIRSYFGNFKGRLLSLGENDGITLSNSRQLILDGWSAVLVEPASTAFAKLEKLYGELIKVPGGIEYSWNRVTIYNVAIGLQNGNMKLYKSGTLLNQGDTDLVSTLVQAETKRWDGVVEFDGEEVQVLTLTDFLEKSQEKTFDFVSIDCEGMDLDILKQMDLEAMGTRCVCVEFNGKNEALYFAHVRKYGFRLLHKNGENLIYVR